MLKMKEKLDYTLNKNYLPSQNEVLKMGRSEKQILGVSEDNILGRRQGIELTNNLGGKEESKHSEVGEDKRVWADELRAADERTNKLREQ